MSRICGLGNLKFSLLLVAVAAFILLGCNDDSMYSSNETSIKISKKGVITGKIVESFDKSYYSADELKTQIDNEITNYINYSSNKKAIKLKSFEVSDGKALAEMEYAEYSDYSKFNDVDFYFGTVEKAIADGYNLDVMLKSTEDNSTIKGNDLENKGEVKIVIVSESIPVVVPGKIKFLSANVDNLDKDVVKMSSESSGLAYIVLD